MTEADKKFNKKDTYTYDEVRKMMEDSIMDRARYLAFFYKVMPRDLFDKYAKRALFAYGEEKANSSFFHDRQKGDVSAMADFLVGANGVNCTPSIGISCMELDKEHALLSMDGKCALVQSWEQMGLSAEEVEYMCLIASYGDFGHCHALGLEGEWLCTSACPGSDRCVFKVTKETADHKYDL